MSDFFTVKSGVDIWDILNAPFTSAIVSALATAIFGLLITQSVNGIKKEEKKRRSKDRS